MVSQSIFSTAQWVAIVWSPRLSGLLSITGSSLVIYMILSGGKSKTSRLHNRLLLGLSSIDILNSSALGVSTWPFPSIFDHLIFGAVGNQTTCRTQGFFLALGVSVPIYTAMLCINYLCVIKYNINDDTLRKYEIYMHLIAIAPPLFVAIFAVAMDIIHPTVKANCWISDGCELPNLDADLDGSLDLNLDDALVLQQEEEEEGTCLPRPKELVNFTKFFATGVGIIAILTIFYCMISIYLSVRKQSKTMTKYKSFSKGNGLSGSTLQQQQQQQQVSVWSDESGDNSGSGLTGPTGPNGTPNRLSLTSLRSYRSQRKGDMKNNNNNKKKKKRKGSHEETFTQAMLYVLSYFLCYIFIIVAQFINDVGFPLMILKAIFYPSQGFWNFLIYVRPRFVEIRQKKKEESFWWVLRAVITGSKVIENEEKVKRQQQRMSMIRRSSVMFYSADQGDKGMGHLKLDGASIKMDVKEGKRLSYSSTAELASPAIATISTDAMGPDHGTTTGVDMDEAIGKRSSASFVASSDESMEEEEKTELVAQDLNLDLPSNMNAVAIDTGVTRGAEDNV